MHEIMQVVSAAIIKTDGDGKRRMLLIQRSPEGSHGWAWATPGGKVEEGESSLAALRRELLEEIFAYQAPRAQWSLLYVHGGMSTTTGKPFWLQCYYVFVGADELYYVRPGDGAIGIGWFTAEEIAGLHLAPADAAQRDVLIARLRTW